MCHLQYMFAFAGVEGTYSDQGQAFEQTGCSFQQQRHRGCGQCVGGRRGCWTERGWTQTQRQGVLKNPAVIQSPTTQQLLTNSWSWSIQWNSGNLQRAFALPIKTGRTPNMGKNCKKAQLLSIVYLEVQHRIWFKSNQSQGSFLNLSKVLFQTIVFSIEIKVKNKLYSTKCT